MQLIDQTLAQIGLSEKESKIYLACFQYGQLGATSLARVTSIPRASIYDYTEKLVQKGFLQLSKQDAATVFFATDPRDLLLLFKRRSDHMLQQADALNNALEHFQKINHGVKKYPQIKYYEGVEAVRMIYKKLQLQYSWSMYNIDVFFQQKTFLDMDDMVTLLSDQSIEAKKIIMYSPAAVEFQKRMEIANKRVEIKILPKDFSIQSDHIMVDGIFWHVSYGDKLSTIEVIDPIFYATQRKIFDFMWERI